MSLAAGVRLGPYEIQSLLGVGGPASVRALEVTERELRRGLAEAEFRRTRW